MAGLMLALDPLRLDRDIAEFARRERRFRAALRSSEALEHAFELVPRGLDDELLYMLRENVDKDPLARHALRWLGLLLLEHALIPETRQAANALRRETHGIHAPESGRYTLAKMRERALAEPAKREGWLTVFARHALALTERRIELWEKRAELREQLRLPAELDEREAEAIAEHALALLALTDDAYRELGIESWTRLLDVALGTRVPGDWPTRLTPRALADFVREGGLFDGLNVEGVEAPALFGASSVLRGLDRLGQAVHEAAAAERRPFVLTHDPLELRKSAAGALFSLIPAKPKFAERRLGIGRTRLRDYTRPLGELVLVGVREAALRALLALESQRGPVGSKRFVELFERALTFEPDARLAGAVFASDPRATKFRALLSAAARERFLTEAHDEDWFRNPRAIHELRAEYETPPPESVDPKELEAGRNALVRSILELF